MPSCFIPTTYFNSDPDTWSLRGFFAASTSSPIEGLELQHVVNVYVRTLSEIAGGSLDSQTSGGPNVQGDSGVTEAASRKRECASLLLTAYKQVCFGAAPTSAWPLYTDCGRLVWCLGDRPCSCASSMARLHGHHRWSRKRGSGGEAEEEAEKDSQKASCARPTRITPAATALIRRSRRVLRQ